MLRVSQRLTVSGLMALFAAALLAEGWQLVESRGAAVAAERALAQKNREWKRLAALDPAPTPARAAGIDEERAGAEDALAVLRGELAGSRDGSARLDSATGASGSGPDTPSDAADLIRALHEQARRAAVNVRPEEQFGLAAIGEEAATPESIMALQRQFTATNSVVQALFAAKPSQLVSVQQTRPRGPANRRAAAQQRPAEDGAGAGSAFDIDPRLSVREPGLIETIPIRLTFVGRTATLRQFLNELLAGGDLVAISEVKAEPADPPRDIRRGRPTASEPVASLVNAAQSRFTVTIEYCELAVLHAVADKKPLSAPGQTIRPAGCSCWREPTPQRRGRDWLYEVFTPPSVFYDRHSRALAAIPADEAMPADPDNRPLDLQFLQARRGAFRLQLVGYAGGRNDLRGIFADTVGGETMIGRAGDRLARAGVLLKQILVSRSGVGERSGAATGEPVATATLTDETTGNEVVLTTRAQSPGGPPLGLFSSRKTPALRRELKEGESVTCNGVRYRVDRIELEPPLAVVACLTPGGDRADRQILTPQTSPSAADVITDASHITPRQSHNPSTHE